MDASSPIISLSGKSFLKIFNASISFESLYVGTITAEFIITKLAISLVQVIIKIEQII